MMEVTMWVVESDPTSFGGNFGNFALKNQHLRKDQWTKCSVPLALKYAQKFSQKSHASAKANRMGGTVKEIKVTLE